MEHIIVDSHQHFWDPDKFRYVWMSPKVQPLVRAFLPSDLQPIISAAGIHQTVVVQAISSIEEARWLLQLASENDFIAGVVTWCDLQSRELGSMLDELQKHPKFKGVRHQIEDEAQDDWMMRERVITSLKEVARRKIPYDMLVRPRHLEYVPAVLERCPGLKMVIDHVAKPQIAERKFEPWAQDLAAIAQHPNVFCKLSGLNTEADWKTWKPQDLKPYVDHVVNIFGYDRVMFGSDWPVCILAGSYQQVVDALKFALGPLPKESSARVWGGNATAFYGLGNATRSTASRS